MERIFCNWWLFRFPRPCHCESKSFLSENLSVCCTNLVYWPIRSKSLEFLSFLLSTDASNPVEFPQNIGPGEKSVPLVGSITSFFTLWWFLDEQKRMQSNEKVILQGHIFASGKPRVLVLGNFRNSYLPEWTPK